MRRIAAIIRKKLDEAVDSAQTNIPAQNLINQFSGGNIPPGGPSGNGFPPAPHATDWADVENTPTTLSGYGITDAAANTEPYLVVSLSGALTNERRLVAGTGITLTDGGAGGDLTIAAMGGSGTVSSVNITAPAAGITATGGPITTSGAITLALANDLAALEALSSTGIAVRSATDTWLQRSIAGTSNRISVTNGGGVAGDPAIDISASYVGQSSITTLGTITTGTWSGSNLSESQITGLVSDLSALSAGIAASQPLDGDLTALAALSSTGLAARTAANTWAQRTIIGTASRLSVTNGDGVSGNPTVDISTSYTGQTTIATLGTVTSGVWAAVSIGVNHGGTGFGVYTVGDILYASGTTAFTKLNAVATGNVLISGGVATAPSWDKVDLTAHVTGLLPPANGGTGAANTGNLAWASGGGTAALISSGTYTPTYLGQATPGTTTYTTQQGAWVKIGNVITVTGTIVWTAASGTGNANISLPFAAASVTDQAFSGAVRVANVTFANGTPVILLSSGASAFILNSPATNAGSTTVAVEAAGSVTFTITYFF